jgi:pimeloyl-ACP methyl ester carboxylesterase
MRFGHDQGDKYSCLVFDNRGMGESDKPLLRYSTTEMARDVVELVDHLGWTSKRQLHIIGVSMGGMISQEVACLIPDRICSLNLISTAARIENTTSFVENLRTRINMFIPKSIDRSVSDAAASLFADAWLELPDDAPVPDENTVGVKLPPGGIQRFPTNFDRFAAQELAKRLDKNALTRKGFILQTIAAGWHHKSPEQLKQLADHVGRERIMVVHGTNDKMITVPHGQKLIDELQPKVGIIREGDGHVLLLEQWKWHDDILTQRIAETEALPKD